MARRRSYYGTDKKTSPRRVLLYTAVFVVVIIAGWQYYQNTYNKPAATNNDDLNVTYNPNGNNSNHSPVGTGNANSGTNSTPPRENIVPVATNPPEEPVEIIQPVPVNNNIDNSYQPQFSEAVFKFNSGVASMDKGDILEARSLLSEAIKDGLPWETEKLARTRLNDLAKRWLFSRDIYEGDSYCSLYKVESGDYLSTIGLKFDIPYQFLMRINNISRPENLRAGENIKVVSGPFNAIADRTKFIITLYVGDTIAYTWPISTGREGRSTPTGKWQVTKGKKLINPEWADPDTGKVYLPDDPENPLGERWIGIHGISGEAIGRTGFGIHGTIEPEMIGKSASRGCIRLRNQDVEILYDMLLEGKSTVEIID